MVELLSTTRSVAPARTATIGRVVAPEGAILADVSEADGVPNEIYAWQRSSQEDCVVDVEAAREMTIACSPSSVAESEGISFVANAGESGGFSGVNVVAMVPDGVHAIQVTDRDGSTHRVGVKNNVVDYAASNVTELRYTMPDSTVRSVHPSS